jgi:hypothetical protein
MLKLDSKTAKESFQLVSELLVEPESPHSSKDSKVVPTTKEAQVQSIKTCTTKTAFRTRILWFQLIQIVLWKLVKEIALLVRQEISRMPLRHSSFSVTVRISILRRLTVVKLQILELIKVCNLILKEKKGSTWFLQSQ